MLSHSEELISLTLNNLTCLCVCLCGNAQVSADACYGKSFALIFPDCPDDINCGEELELTDFSHDNNEALLEPRLHEKLRNMKVS